jgi:hypothetical protein
VPPSPVRRPANPSIDIQNAIIKLDVWEEFAWP